PSLAIARRPFVRVGVVGLAVLVDQRLEPILAGVGGRRGGLALDRLVLGDQAVIGVHISAELDLDELGVIGGALDRQAAAAAVGEVIKVGAGSRRVGDRQARFVDRALAQRLVDQAQIGDPRPRVGGANVGGPAGDA